MAAKFFALLTVRGSEKLASATALGTQLKLTHMAVGDGNGTLPTPTASQTALINEKRRAAINSLTVDPLNPSQIIAEQVIPEDEGGFWIREIGVFDDTGELIAIANCAETYKPVLAEGSGRTQVIRMVLIVSSTDAVTLKIDPSVVLATRKYVDDQTIIVKAYADDLMTKHLAAADPHTQYAPKDSPTLTGTPKAPTAAASTNTTQIATTAFVQAVITALKAGAPATLDTLDELAAAINDDPNFSTTITNALALKAPLASPALSGTPTAPTAAQSVNNTQLATTAFVKAAIAALVASSPATLDTLNELAAALGNDPNFATTIANALALKAPLASPDLTGKPTAPTAAAGTNTTQLATTAFVQAVLNALGLGLSGLNNATGLDWQNDDFITGTITRYQWQAFTNPPTLTGPQPLATATIVVTVKMIVGSIVVVELAAVRSSTSYECYDVIVSGAKGSRTLAVRMTYQRGMGTPVAVSDGGTGGTTPATARTGLGFDDMGIGLGTSLLISNFDWQQADFITGSLQAFQFSASLNQPSGITYGSTTSVTVTTLQNRTSLIVVKVVPLTQSNGNRREYTVTISGAKGARTFTVNQNFNDDSSSVIPIANGGTGQTTAAAALLALGGAPLASPALSGTPTAPTAAQSVNTTQLATTAFVHAASSGVIGDSRNAAISLATASASATFTADEVVVGTALGGSVWRMSNISKTINLATTGAGGMDTGSAPASGWVAIYLIYNPATNTSALLAQNVTSTVAPTVYGGANMPSGYTASALVSVWRTTAASILLNGYQRGRKFCIPRVDVLNTSSNPGGYTPIPLSAAVPLNAISASGYVFCNSGSGSGYAAFSVGSDANGLGYFQVYAGLTGSLGSDIYFESMLPVAQNLFYTFTWTTSAASSATLGISGYTI